MRRTKEQAAETGRQILQAAETLFLDKGYDNVSLEEIAALSGVTLVRFTGISRTSTGFCLLSETRRRNRFGDLPTNFPKAAAPLLSKNSVIS